MRGSSLFTKQILYRILPLIVVVFCFVSGSVSAQTVDVELNVQGCNNNNICEANLGEDINNCSNDCIYIPPATGGGSTSNNSSNHSSYANLILSDIQVRPGATSVIISWKTNRISIGTLAWGLTSDYELGTVSEINYTNNHSVKIENLFPNQTYYFRIDSQDTRQVVTSVKGLGFTTLAIPDSAAPANVTRLEGVLRGESVQLTWRNPSDTDFDVVRVVRSTSFFPKDPMDGKVVYEGRGSYTSDSAITPGTTYYYAVFARDYTGNYASGAVLKMIVPAKLPTLPAPGSTSTVIVIPGEPDPFGQYPTTPIAPRASSTVIGLVDFDVIQRGEKISFSESSIRLDERDNVTLSINYTKLPENLKTIAVTVQDPTVSNKKYTYLLQVNKDKTAYETTLDNFDRAGTYKFNITVLDYKQQSLKKFEGAFVVLHDANQTENKNIIAEYEFVDFIIPILIFILVIIAFLLLIRLVVAKVKHLIT